MASAVCLLFWSGYSAYQTVSNTADAIVGAGTAVFDTYSSISERISSVRHDRQREKDEEERRVYMNKADEIRRKYAS